LHGSGFGDLTLGQYLEINRFNQIFVKQYIIPMGAAIWSTPDDKMMEFPAQTFAHFFENHGLLTVTDHPQWYTIKGGSHEYVKAFLKGFQGKVFTSTAIQKITRESESIRLKSAKDEHEFDAVIIAAHADEAFQMLSDPSSEETRLLSPWRYTENQTILHRDISFLPPIDRARSAWNYFRETGNTDQKPMTMTYYMNMLQCLETEHDYCVTLNPYQNIPKEKMIGKFYYTHPQFTFEAINTQKELDTMNGKKNTYFCGSYFRYGFHEDAVLSAVNVTEKFGISL
jgi:predicted NAD/FAD-binding protein